MSFINSLFLFATAAAALPILYHLVRRVRAKTVPFPSLRFLQATPKKLVRKRRLKDRLLMAMRALLLLLLALVFARPYLPAEQIPFVEQRESASVVLLVDRSFSMQHSGAFPQAVAAARERIDAGGPADEFALIAFDDRAELLASLDTDPTVARTAVRTLDASYRPTDVVPALQRAADLLQEARHEQQVVVMISDFQETGWTGTLEDWTLPPGVAFETIRVGPAEETNAYVEAVQQTERRTGNTGVLQLDARVTALGAAATREHTATLVVDGAEVDRRTLPGRPSAPLSFQHAVSQAGVYQGRIELEGDALAVDDRYYFTHRTEALPGILAVDAPPQTGRRDAFYLERAFDLEEGARFRFDRASRAEAPTLRQSDLVFWANRTAEARDVALLRRFVEDGGTLVVSAGDRVEVQALSRLLESLGVGRVGSIVDARAELGYEAIVGDADLRHPVFQPFAERGAGAIFRPTFRHYARLVPHDSTTVIARFDSGDPVLAERSMGAGRVLFYASTFNTSWTDLPIDEMYVPLLYQMAAYGTRDGDASRIVRVGTPIPLSGVPSGTVEVRDPEGRLYPVTLDAQGRGVFRETDVPGHYAVSGGEDPQFFSVNVDPRESDLRRRDLEEAYAAVVAPPADVPDTPEEATAAVETEERRQKLWRGLLLVVLALFAGETVLAHRGTGAKQTRTTDVRSRRARRSMKHST